MFYCFCAVGVVRLPLFRTFINSIAFPYDSVRAKCLIFGIVCKWLFIARTNIKRVTLFPFASFAKLLAIHWVSVAHYTFDTNATSLRCKSFIQCIHEYKVRCEPSETKRAVKCWQYNLSISQYMNVYTNAIKWILNVHFIALTIYVHFKCLLLFFCFE